MSFAQSEVAGQPRGRRQYRTEVLVADEARVSLGKQKADKTLCTMSQRGGLLAQNENPRVAVQNDEYIVKQRIDFKVRADQRRRQMTSVATALDAADIRNLAQYLVGLRVSSRCLHVGRRRASRVVTHASSTITPRRSGLTPGRPHAFAEACNGGALRAVPSEQR